jgi:hypothetical protein
MAPGDPYQPFPLHLHDFSMQHPLHYMIHGYIQAGLWVHDSREYMSTGLLELLQSYALNPSTPARLASEAVSMAITPTMMDLASASFQLPCPLGLDRQASDLRLLPFCTAPQPACRNPALGFPSAVHLLSPLAPTSSPLSLGLC